MFPGAGVAMAHAPASPFLSMGAVTQPPRGFTEMCGAQPALCASFAGRGDGGAGGGAAPDADPPLSFLPGDGFTDTVSPPEGEPPGWDGQQALRIVCQPGDAADGLPRCMVAARTAPAWPAGWAMPGGVSPDVGLAGITRDSDSMRGVVRPGVAGEGLPSLPRVPPALADAGFAGRFRIGRPPVGGRDDPPSPASMATSGLRRMAWLMPIPHPLPGVPVPRAAVEVSGGSPAIAAPGLAADWPKLLARVNARVNAHVYQQSDMATYGVPEMWRPSGMGRGAVGDCEDLALEKRVELLASHFPPERLFLAVVWRGDVGLHTVLLARLDGGDVVLDSRLDYIEPWARAGYDWVSVETPGHPQEWREAS